MIRARIEFVLAALFGVAAIATIIWPTWIESLIGFEPDKGTGEAEWWLVVLLGAAALITGGLAYRDARVVIARQGGEK